METKTVIRIEHPKDGKGIWQSKNEGDKFIINSLSCFDDIITKHIDFPVPYCDGLSIGHDDFCAFKSVEQVKQWIDDTWWNEIIDAGFKVYMIDISVWQEGEHQILFKKKDIAQQKDITSLFKTLK